MLGEAALDCFDTNPLPGSAPTPSGCQSGSGTVERRSEIVVACSRLLAGATATAILLSGLNALVQIVKIAVEYVPGGW